MKICEIPNSKATAEGKHELQLVWCVESADDNLLPRIEYGRELLRPNLFDVVDREGLRFQYHTTNELPSLQEPKSWYFNIEEWISHLPWDKGCRRLEADFNGQHFLVGPPRR